MEDINGNELEFKGNWIYGETVLINGEKRKVHYSAIDGLYIWYKGYKYFEYEWGQKKIKYH